MSAKFKLFKGLLFQHQCFSPFPFSIIIAVRIEFQNPAKNPRYHQTLIYFIYLNLLVCISKLCWMRKPRIKKGCCCFSELMLAWWSCVVPQLSLELNSTDESLWRAIKNERANHVRMNTLQNNDQKSFNYRKFSSFFYFKFVIIWTIFFYQYVLIGYLDKNRY